MIFFWHSLVLISLDIGGLSPLSWRHWWKRKEKEEATFNISPKGFWMPNAVTTSVKDKEVHSGQRFSKCIWPQLSGNLAKGGAIAFHSSAFLPPRSNFPPSLTQLLETKQGKATTTKCSWLLSAGITGLTGKQHKAKWQRTQEVVSKLEWHQMIQACLRLASTFSAIVVLGKGSREGLSWIVYLRWFLRSLKKSWMCSFDNWILDRLVLGGPSHLSAWE